jgi:hypothetical protein
MGILVFSNIGEMSPGSKALEMANLLIKDTTQKNAKEISKEIDSSGAALKDTSWFKSYMGNYIADDGSQSSFRMERRKIYWQSDGMSSLLIKGVKDTFTAASTPETKLVFNTIAGSDKLVSVYYNSNERQFAKFKQDSNQDDKQLQTYTGIYYCPELDCKYGIRLNDHHLLLTHSKYQDTQLTLIGKMTF